ncbi:MAG: Holliday junction resolvase RuvX [Rickettsiales bacterium]|jgi:putative Holliday junction resolvase|nr:Holliday junction resolvase RuvX [Rickettsiales bacterium]
MIIFDINQFKNSLKDGYRLLGLDIGKVRIGSSLSDENKILASGHLLFNLKKQKFTLSNLRSIIDNEKVHGIVVGYPLQMDGEKGDSCFMVDKFIEKFVLPLNQPIFLQDERLSTAAVGRFFKEMELTRKQQADRNDVASARYILQNVIDKLENIK